MTLQGLAPHTNLIFEDISKLECLKEYTLVGGTALSLQINTRQSEDLDFIKWQQTKSSPCEVSWPTIQQELETIGNIDSIDILGLDHVIFVLNGVKISFYSAPRRKIATMTEVSILNNIKAADIESIGIMKMEVLMRRNKFRDYYDIYSILKAGKNINTIIAGSLEHSDHKLKSKNLMAMITNGSLFSKDAQFAQLNPVYDITPTDIQEYIKTLLLVNKR